MPIHTSTRHEIPDGLKTLALLGVFMINGLGYALAPYYPLQVGAPVPIHSALAQTIHVLALMLFMGKALPLLAFLFGYSMANYAARLSSIAKFKRRQYKLLLIGVLHGVFLYFGDILTSYALVGLWLANALMLRGTALALRWRWWFMVGVVLEILKLFIEWKYFQPVISQMPDVQLQLLTGARTYGQFLAINALAYWGYLVGWLLSYYVPIHICLFLTGILAARYKWLSLKPKLPALFLRPWLYRSWPLALLANFLLGLASVHLHNKHGLSANVGWIPVLNVPLGIWLVASVLTRLMVHLQTTQTVPEWLLWLAPAGRHTLAMYLGLSLTMVLCARLGMFTSAGAWNHTAIWFAAWLVLWLGAVCLGRAATKRQMRDPISRWLSK
jgi:uncharacterized protein